jgi:hypothetical protein
LRVEFDARTKTLGVTGEQIDLRWTCDLDERDGSARIQVAGEDFCVRPLTWRQKTLLARHAALGTEFVEHRFLQMSAGTARLPVDGTDREVLRTLALWVNAPGTEPFLPLDSIELTAVTVDVCRSTGFAPGTLDDREAIDVENIWRALGGGSGRGNFEEKPAARVDAESAHNVIRVIPDEDSPSTRESLKPRSELPPIKQAHELIASKSETRSPRSPEVIQAATITQPPAEDPSTGKLGATPLRWARPRRVASLDRQPVPTTSPIPNQPVAPMSEPQAPPAQIVIPEASETSVRLGVSYAFASHPAAPAASALRSTAPSTAPLNFPPPKPAAPAVLRPNSWPEMTTAEPQPIDLDAIFLEFSDRLEEAAGQLGIDVRV